MGKAADLALIERVQRGDRSAFDALVLKYQYKVLQVTRRYVSDPSEALDVTQEAFLRAWRAAPSFRGDSAFYTWLYRIAVNTAKNYVLVRGRRSRHSYVDLQDPQQSDVFDSLEDADTPDGIMQADEIRKTVCEAIAELPDDLRLALAHKEVDGLSYQDIARAMNCPIGTVRSRIFRAREMIDKRVRALLE